MFERVKFARYALRFERAFKTDRWDDVRACFHDDASYVIEGTATRYDGESRGADAIIQTFRTMLDALDRKFDRRQPRIVGFPRVVDGELVLRWSARYTLGAEAAIVTGTSHCRFDGSKIRRLSDTMNADECKRWGSLIGVTV